MLFVLGFILMLGAGDTFEQDVMLKLGGAALLCLHLLKERYLVTTTDSRI